ncbi:cytochrome P450 [Pantoea sp.]|uniref:cytochrome P450 n=1 Tax=Pantoea sp. TaxID=69393 RepID=UPI00289DDBB2|nr:cytochrome P450 [Pantoea sp.]
MRKLHQLPAPPAHDILGHVYYLKQTNIHQQMIKWRDEYGPLYRLRLGAKKALVITNPDVVKKVLSERPEKFRRISNINSVFEEAGMNGVFSSEGERWRYQRKIIDQAFQPKNLKNFLPGMRQLTERFRVRLDKIAAGNENVFLTDEFKHYTANIIALLAFGEDINIVGAGENKLSASMREIFPVLHQRCRSPIPFWRFFKTENDKRFDAAMKYLKETVLQFISHQRQQLQNHPHLHHEPENILQVMLLEQKNDAFLSDEDIVANAVTLMLAGEDTTANTLAWIVYLVSQRPDIEMKLLAEFNAFPLNQDKESTWPLPQLPWLTAVMYEAMRLKPVAPQLYLEPHSDMTINDIYVKRGTPVLLMLHGGGLSESCFQDARSFTPERWIERDGASFSNMLPFGSGPRLCPGRALAMMEICMALQALYSGFQVKASQAAESVTEKFTFTMAPDNFRVRLQKRESRPEQL